MLHASKAWKVRSAVTSLFFAHAVSGCLSFDDRSIRRDLPQEPTEEELVRDDPNPGSEFADDDAGLPSSDPHALLAISPNHGPFTGGQTVSLRGNGFNSDVQAWFGDVPALDVVSVDPNRVQATTPPGATGPVDVIVQNGDDETTRRVLVAAYEYDAFVVEPSAGPGSGGTLLTLTSTNDAWDDDANVTVDLLPCALEGVELNDEGLYQITCRTPANTPGKKVVTVETGNGDKASVAGAFAYSDNATEYEGGLSGDALDGQLEVVVLNGLFGEPQPGATVILGSDFDPAFAKLTGDDGRARFESSTLNDAVTVTVAMPCMHPVTWVDVPVERATIYIDPILTPSCIPPSFDSIPLGGGAGAAPMNRISGELIWGEGLETRPGPWVNVPGAAHDQEEQVAYLFELAQSADGNFNLPSRFDAVTLDDRGSYGYLFEYDTRSAGNITLYALAGVEDRSVNPRRFTPYVLGMLRGVDASTEPTGLLMSMSSTLDHQLSIELEPPIATASGPDRARIEIALRVGAQGYVRLPGLQREHLLPSSEPVRFVGVPALSGPLEQAEYLARVAVVSGPDGALPASHIDLVSTRQTDAPIVVGNFVPVPVIAMPELNGAWDGRGIVVDFEAGGTFDLLRFDILIPKASMTWQVIAPGERREVDLPPLRDYGFTIPSGRVTVGAAAARIKNFDYSALRERDTVSRGFSAFATNALPAVLK